MIGGAGLKGANPMRVTWRIRRAARGLAAVAALALSVPAAAAAATPAAAASTALAPSAAAAASMAGQPAALAAETPAAGQPLMGPGGLGAARPACDVLPLACSATCLALGGHRRALDRREVGGRPGARCPAADLAAGGRGGGGAGSVPGG